MNGQLIKRYLKRRVPGANATQNTRINVPQEQEKNVHHGLIMFAPRDIEKNVETGLRKNVPILGETNVAKKQKKNALSKISIAYLRKKWGKKVEFRFFFILFYSP